MYVSTTRCNDVNRYKQIATARYLWVEIERSYCPVMADEDQQNVKVLIPDFY